MNDLDFFLLFISNIYTYILSIVISFLCFYPILKLYKFHLFHPYFIQYIFAIFANSIPVFLFLVGECTAIDFLYFVLSEVLFWFGFIFFLTKNKNHYLKYSIEDEKSLLKLMFYFFFIFFLIITIFSYIKYGIPLFMWSRVGLYVDSGGAGLIYRIQPMLKVFIIFYAFTKIFNETKKKKGKIFFILVLIILLVEGVLSGSKSSFLDFIVVYYFYAIINDKYSLSMRNIIFVGLIVIITGISGALIKDYTIGDTILAFMKRFISSGDVYFYGLPNQVYKSVIIENPYEFLASGFLLPARLMELSNIEIHPGNQLFYLIWPGLEGLLSGPNSRMPFISIVLFGWTGGLIFSFISGFFFSLITNLTKLFFYGNKLFFPMYIYITFMLAQFIYDITMGIGKLFSIFVNLSIYLLIVVFSALLIKIHKKNA